MKQKITKNTPSIGVLGNRFDKSLWSKHLFGPTDPSIVFSSLVDEFDSGRPFSTFPLENHRLSKHFGEQPWEVEGQVLINVGLPLLIQKSDNTLIASRYCIRMWELEYLDKDDDSKICFENYSKKLLQDCRKRYPSLKDLSQGSVIRFPIVSYEFTEETKRKHKPKIKEMFNKLLDNDEFVEYILSILLPYYWKFQWKGLNEEISLLNDQKKEVLSLLTTL